MNSVMAVERNSLRSHAMYAIALALDICITSLIASYTTTRLGVAGVVLGGVTAAFAGWMYHEFYATRGSMYRRSEKTV